MPASILATKISIPPPRKIRVPRPRLTELLSSGTHRKLTLVCAPAGFGKSTLVADWLASRDGPAAWISLDESDGQVSSFLAYLVAAVQTITGRGNELLEMVRSPQSSPASVVASILDDLVALDEELVIVLDDYHLVDSPEVDNVLRYLVDHVPQQTHLVITTREDPQIALSRLRARDELNEIRVADLRFHSREVRFFLNQVMELGLSAQAIRTLEERTEGWVAGLQLAALSMQSAADREGFVEAFSGSHRFVLDYLVEDVLDRLPSDTRAFLDTTSILDRFCPDLCDAVTGRTDSAAVIDYLDRANLFVMPLDAERRWYRYHRLFLDLLRGHRDGLAHDSTPLHLRASEWYGRNGLPLDAFAHAVAAGDTDRAEEILDGEGLPIHYRGRFAPVERWLTSLPPQVLDERPALRIASAWVLTTRGAKLDAVEALLGPAETAVLATPAGPGRDDLRGQIAAIRALLAIPRGEIEPIIANGHLALELVDLRNVPVRTTVAWSLGYAHQMLGELAAARAAFEQAIRDGRGSGNLVVTIGATLSLGQVCESQRRLRQATELYREALRLAGSPPLAYACEAFLGLARIQYEHNDLETARENARRAVELGRHLENVDTPGMAAVLEARVDLAEGNHEAATSAVERAQTIFRERGIEHHASDLADVRVQIHIGEEHLVAAMEIAEAHHLTDRIAQVALLQTDPEKALTVLGTYVHDNDTAAVSANLGSHAIAAAAFWSRGECDRAIEKLAAVLSVADQEGIVRSIVDVGPPVHPVLSASALRKRYPACTTALLAALPELAVCTSLADPLSPRELEVLALIADGLSNREIGERLFIALDTVKGHTRKIFEKLDVSRRTEAVARATEIGLL